jgi:hypothetical protein
LSQEIQLEIITNGGFTPALQLLRVGVNQTGTFFDTGRDRTSDLLVTFGPLDPTQDNSTLAYQASNIHFAQQINIARPSSNSFIFSVFPPIIRQ